MGKNPREHLRWQVGLPTALAVGVAIVAQSIGLGDVLDRRVHDTYIRVAASVVPPIVKQIPDVVVVTIDPRSLRASESWPWSREVHARIVDRLSEAGARAVAFDIDFSSPASVEADARFSAAMRESGRVVLATFSQSQRLEGGGDLEIVNRPIPLFEQSSAGLGSVLVPIDSDGVVRNAPRDSEIGGVAIPSLARAALRVAADDSLRERIERMHNVSEATLIDFRRYHPRIPTVSYIDVLEGQFNPAVFSGRAVFIGATAAEFQDIWATPAEPALPGVMIQAIAYRTAAAEVMGQTLLSSAPMPWLIAGYFMLGLATLPREGSSGIGRVAIFAGVGLGSIVVSWWALWVAGVLIPLTVGLGLLASQYALGIESLQRAIRVRADAQESSLSALARMGDVTRGQDGESGAHSDDQGGLGLALELLGDVVQARGIVLLRAEPGGRLDRERIEWRPRGEQNQRLVVDEAIAVSTLANRRVVEHDDPFAPGASTVYSPLLAGRDCVGVLVVLCRPGQAVDSIRSRTIATVTAQLALTAQNLRLIDRLRETFESSIAAVAGAVEARDGYTDQHCRRLAAFSSLMGTRLGMPAEEIRAMELGALLHDVGKIGIPDAVLNKPGRLSNEERHIMQRHPEIGAGIVAPVIGLEPTTLHCVIHHHERWDGQGYPEGLEGTEIPLAARIVSIVDVWDALSTQRPYKKAFSQTEVRDLLTKGRSTQFDPELIDLFFEVLNEQGEEMLELIARSSTSGVIE